MLKHIHHITTWLIFLVIAGGYFLMARDYPFAYIIATYEDLIGEWAQVYFFATALGLSLIHAFKTSRFRLFYGVLALACFYVVGEEISWGQRIFDVSSPEFFKQHNLQKETNLHNFLTGPISTWIKDALEYSIAAGLVGYGLIYPFALKMKTDWARWFEDKGLPAPPLFLFPFFVLSAFLELGFLSFNEAEIAEILIPSALSIMILCHLFTNRNQASVHEKACFSPSQSCRLATAIVFIFLTVSLLAVGTTWACYSTPHLRNKIENRFLNGVEKFAGRYQRNELWENAILLYQHSLEKEPFRASIHRNLYRCYLGLGDTEKMQQQIEQAIKIDEQRLLNKPDSITAHVSMARNYRLAGDRQAMIDYLQRGLQVAEERQIQTPASASTAYWLGKLHQMRGNPIQAKDAFWKAVELDPNNLKYRKAYRKIAKVSG